MKIHKDLHVTLTEGELELRMGRALTSFYFKGHEKFVFRNPELKTLCTMIQKGEQELADFVETVKKEVDNPPSPE